MADDFNLREEVERRGRLSTKVYVLEERMKHNSEHIERIEAMLEKMESDDSALMTALNTTLGEFKQSIDTKIVLSMQPLKDDITKYKTIIGVAISVGGVLLSLVSVFKDQILNLFH